MLTQLNLAGTLTAQWISPDSIPAAVTLLQILLVVNHRAVHTEEIPAQAQSSKWLRIAWVEHMIDMEIDNMMTAFNAWTLQMSKANEPHYRRYQAARVSAIQADHPTLHTPITLTTSDSSMVSTHCWPGLNHHQHSRRGLGPWINCDELGHIRMFCSSVPTHHIQGTVNLNQCGGVTWGPTGGHGC